MLRAICAILIFFFAIFISAAIAPPTTHDKTDDAKGPPDDNDVVIGANDPAAATAIDFATHIRPIFQRRCFECHGPVQQKGHLRLDRRDGALRGEDPEDWVIQPGDPQASELYRRITLPADDFDIMPASGDPLAAAEIELIRQWIESGAAWDAASEGEGLTRSIVLSPLTDAQKAAERRAIARIIDRGGVVLPVSADSIALSVNFSVLAANADDEVIDDLRGLEPTLVWLNLARTRVTDEGARRLGEFRELRRIHLERTGITDETLRAIAQLPHLEYLNVYGTRVTDNGLAHLRKLKELARLYLWRTRTTEQGVAELQAALPGLRIETGELAAIDVPPETVQETEEQSPDAAELSCCEKALAQDRSCAHACCAAARERGEVCAICNPAASEELKRKILGAGRENDDG